MEDRGGVEDNNVWATMWCIHGKQCGWRPGKVQYLLQTLGKEAIGAIYRHSSDARSIFGRRYPGVYIYAQSLLVMFDQDA